MDIVYCADAEEKIPEWKESPVVQGMSAMVTGKAPNCFEPNHELLFESIQ